jgi:inosose dehydratase
VHLKDLDRARLDRVLATGGGFWEAVAAGVFRPLGSGSVDLPAVLSALDDAGYRGWATVEQDRVPGGGDPVADVRRSVDYLATLAPPVDLGRSRA